MRELMVLLQAKVPGIVWGQPGVGKTKFIEALARAWGVPIEVVIAAIREPSDFGGLPVINNGGVDLHPPGWAQRLNAHALAAIKAIVGGVLFIDEISTAPPAVQAALLRVVLDRYVGDTKLADNIAILAAANPPEEAAGGWDLAPPLANRFCHLDWSLDPMAWVDGMVGGWPTPDLMLFPDDWEKHIPAFEGLVASFIKAKPTNLLVLPKNEAEAGRAWPSPRTWDMSARLLAGCESIDADKSLKINLICGCVGEGPATEFFRWEEEMDLPDPEDILAAPSKFKMPKRGDRQFAILNAIAAAVKSNNTKDRWESAWVVMEAAAQSGIADIAAPAAKTLILHRPKGGNLKKVTAIKEFKELMVGAKKI